MAERETVINKLRLTYEGLFDAKGLYKLIEEHFEEMNYDKVEKKNIEVVKPEGKYIEIETEPYKAVTDYYKNIIHIRIIMSELKEVEIEKEGIKIVVNQGKLQLVFDGYIQTDYLNKWESKPQYFFLRTLFNKYFFKPYTKSYYGSVKNDLMSLHSKIKAYLNMYRP